MAATMRAVLVAYPNGEVEVWMESCAAEDDRTVAGQCLAGQCIGVGDSRAAAIEDALVELEALHLQLCAAR